MNHPFCKPVTKTDQLFRKTRLRLTSWYAGVMGATVLAGGLLLYHCVALVENWWFDRTVEDLAGTIHDYLLPQLKKPGQLQPEISTILAGVNIHQDNLKGVTRLHNYYVRLLDPGGRPLFQSTFQPVGLTSHPLEQRWQTMTAADGTRYRQLDDYLHNHSGQVWGYLQIGRSLAESDTHLQQLGWILILSTPAAMLGVGIAGWGMAGLAMRPIHRSYRQIQQFTADAAHELRTPLATTRMLVQTTLSKAEMGKTIDPDTLRVIERQNERLSNLVADLLLLSRMEETTSEFLAQQPCSLNDLIADLQEELASLAQSAEIDLKIDIPNVPVIVMGNPDQLYRLFTNLITNGIQYTPVGGKVTIHLSTTAQKAIVAVEDRGIGIPLEAQPHIFDRFYRVDAARARHSGGSGLGLAIGQAIAQLHKGHIQVQSQPGQGSIFTVTLPRISSQVQGAMGLPSWEDHHAT